VKLQTSPHLLPRVPELLCLCRARVISAAGRFPISCRPAPPSPRPRVAVLPLPPPAPPPLAVPRSATSGRRCRAAATHPKGTPAPPAILSPARDCPLPLPLSFSAVPSYKDQLNPIPSPDLLFFHLATPKLIPCSSPEFAATVPPRPNSSYPPLPHLLR
jgi:hypothetical protein